MSSETDPGWRPTRWVCTDYSEPELAAAVRAREPERFRRAVTAIEEALEEARGTGDFSDVHAKYSATLTFLSGRAQLAPEDLRRCAHVAIDIIHACSGDISAQARWGGMATRILEIHGKRLSLRVAWRPLYDILARYLAGESTGYNGAIPQAVHVAVISRLAQKARRHFSPDAPREIWAELKPKIRSVETNDCFEGLGMLHLLMPCMRVGSTTCDAPWKEWADEWAEAMRWMPTNRFWLTAWTGVFSQLAKHDARRVVDWDAHAAHLRTVALWFMEVPVGGGEGACPFGRRTSSRAAYLFNRSVNDAEQRCRVAAKTLVYRLDDAGGADAMDAAVDVVENYAHPSNAGRWTQNLALFLGAAVKHLRKRLARGDASPPSAAVRDRFAAAATRLVDKGMYSKNATLRFAAASAAGQLAYVRPAATLPLVMRRFSEAVDHGTATHQLAAALSALTTCVRPMLSAPPEAFGEGPGPGEYLAAALDATLPGIDANDPAKTLGTIRLYVAVVSNLGTLADPGDEGANERFPFAWSEWIDALLGRLFAFFENVDPGNAGKADGADKHRGGAGGDGGASYLMGSSSMYSPLMRLLFARMHPSYRARAVKRVAHFALTSTHSGLVGEVGQMVMAAVTQAPEEATQHLVRPLLDALASEVEDVAALVEDNADGKLSADQMVSPTREAKLKWQTSLLGAGMHYGGPRIVAIADEVMTITARLFHLCDSAKSIRLGEFGAHLASLLCGAVTGTYVVDLFAPEAARDDPDAELPARWVVSKVRDGEDGTPDLGENFLPEPFAWRRPSEDELAVARRAAKAFIDAPAGELVAAFGPGGDGALGKERVRAALASIGGVAGGFRTRMADFAPEPARHLGDEPPRPVAIQDVAPAAIGAETRSLAAAGVAAALAGASADDTETLGMALSVAEDLMAPSNRDFHGCKSALRTWHADATALTHPKIGPDGRKTRPRWLVGEYAFLRFLWRSSQAAYHAGGPGARPPADRAYRALLAQIQRLSLHKYKSVRNHARSLVEQCAKRFSSATAELCAPSRDALAATPADEDRCVAACAMLKSTMSVNRLRSDPTHFRATVAALLASSHHDAEKAQTAVNELFLSIAIRFSRAQLRDEGTAAGAGALHPDLEATRDHIYALMSPKSLDPAASVSSTERGDDGDGDGDFRQSPGGAMHWSYSLMANALLLFLVHPRVSADEMRRLVQYAMSCMLGHLKVLRLPAACALLMLSRYDDFDDVGAPEVRRVLVRRPRALADILTNLGLCHHAGETGANQAMSRADTLLQAAENLYGAGADMSGTPWPRQRGAASETQGHFVVACARVFKLFAAVAPETVATELEGPVRAAAIASGDRGARCAAAEALAGILASPATRGTPWAVATLVKSVIEAAADATEEWLRAVRYAVRGESIAEGAPEILDVIVARPDRDVATVAQQARRLEAALMCVAQLSSPRSGFRFQSAILAELAAEGETTPLAHDSRAVREEAARVAAALIGAHAGDGPVTLAGDDGSGAEGPGDLRGMSADESAELRRNARALMEQFAAGADAAAREALAANPAEKSAEAAAAKAAVNAAAAASAREEGGSAEGVAMDVDFADSVSVPSPNERTNPPFTAPPGRGQHWLEGIMMTVIQLCKHGDAAYVPDGVARLLPAVLRTQEPPDRDFALVSKRCLTYLKYIVFPRRCQGVVLEGILAGLRDPQWHARAASLKFAQAFAFRHAFALTRDETMTLRDEVAARLTDSQIEVRTLASATLVGFLRGAGAADGAADALRARFLAAAKTPPPKRRRGDGDGGGTNGADATRAHHGAVLGVAACILSSPYDVPEWMPEHLETLARWAGQPSPVKETVQRAFGEFKKTHQDTWAETKAAFTSEQWENVSIGMELAPSYIS